jgi:GTP:adenosylcobinamide-phosphate guanylyltransferase
VVIAAGISINKKKEKLTLMINKQNVVLIETFDQNWIED